LTLQPGQEVRLPVTYYGDPAILQDEEARVIKQITLCYTFHEDKEATAALAKNAGANPLDRPANAR